MYLISYDLRKPIQNYRGLHEAIKKLGNWAKPLESLWLVRTDKNAQRIYDLLRPHIDDDDLILVIDTSNDYQGWLSPEIWDWMNSRRAA